MSKNTIILRKEIAFFQNFEPFTLITKSKETIVDFLLALDYKFGFLNINYIFHLLMQTA